MRELEANLETARDGMGRVELEWEGNLEGILSRTGSIRVRGVPDYKEEGNPITVAGKHRKKPLQQLESCMVLIQLLSTLKRIKSMFVIKGITKYKSLMNL